MSFELALGFNRWPIPGSPPLCHHRLKLDHSAGSIEDELKAVAVPLPEGAYWYSDDGLKVETTDCYGEPLTWVPAHTLASRLEQLDLQDWDLALLAYVKALPPGAQVVLWWC